MMRMAILALTLSASILTGCAGAYVAGDVGGDVGAHHDTTPLAQPHR